MKRLAAALMAVLLLGATLVMCGAARAEDAPVRLPALKPRGSIDAAGLRRLAEREKLSALGRAEGNEENEESEVNSERIIEPGSVTTFVRGNDPPPALTQSFGYSWTLRRSFRGNRFDGARPSDPALAVSPTHLVEMTNLHIVFYTKAGDSLGGVSMDGFFPNDPLLPSFTDPRVEYDPSSGRFFAMVLTWGSTPSSAFELAVSNNSDPTAGWTFYEVRNEQDGQGIDYPYLGFGPGAVYLSGNYRDVLFGWPRATPKHTGGLWVIDKAALLAATTATVWRFTDVPGQAGPVTPEACARWSATPAGVDNFLICPQWVSASDWAMNVYGVTLPAGWPSVAPTLDRHSYTTPALGTVPNATQKGGPALLDASRLGSPPSPPIFINGHIHTALHGPSGSGMFIRHFDVNVSGWTSVNGTTEDFWDGSSYHYYPAVAVNPWGDVGLIFSRSSTSEYVSAIWTLRPQDEVVFQASQTLKAGEAYYGSPGDNASSVYRWGDYTAAAIDPVTGGLWFVNMYAVTGTISGTWIGYVPHAVFVDASSFLFHTGSRTYPWNQFLDGYNSAWNENDLVLKAGSYHAGPGVLGKPLTVKSDGGTATITP